MLVPNSNYVVSRGGEMTHVCNIDDAHEGHQIVHYLKDMVGSDDNTIMVKSPRNIRQCRSPIYEYGLINYIPKSECSVKVKCGEMNGGECNYMNGGNYNLDLELRHAWSTESKNSRGQQRICKNIVYERRLVHNDMIMIKMTLHNDPQDRGSSEKFVCTIERKCSPLGSYKDIQNYQVTSEAPFYTTHPGITSSTSKHQEQQVSETYLVTATSPNDQTSFHSLGNIMSSETTFSNLDPLIHNQTKPLSVTSMPNLVTISDLSTNIDTRLLTSDTFEFSTLKDIKHPVFEDSSSSTSKDTNHTTEDSLNVESIKRSNPATLPHLTSTTYPPSIGSITSSVWKHEHLNDTNSSTIDRTETNNLDNDKTMDDHSKFSLLLSVNQIPVMTKNITLNGNLDSMQLNFDTNTIMVSVDNDSKTTMPSINDASIIDTTTTVLQNVKEPNKIDPNASVTEPNPKIEPFLPENTSNVLPTTNISPFPFSFDRTLSCTSMLNAFKAMTKEFISLFYPQQLLPTN